MQLTLFFFLAKEAAPTIAITMEETIKTGINAIGVTTARVTAAIAAALRGRLAISRELVVLAQKDPAWIIGVDVAAVAAAAVATFAELSEALIALIMHLEVKPKRRIKNAIKSYMLY